MRCPKCHYLSFDPEPRCKNCGYDLDVAVDDHDHDAFEVYEEARQEAKAAPEEVEEEVELVGAAPALRASVRGAFPDLPLRVVEPVSRPPVTLELVPVAVPEPEPIPAPKAPAPFIPAEARTEARPGVVSEPGPQPVRRPAPARAPHTTTELPLFVKSIPQEVEVPPAPRPLSVRRPVEPSKTSRTERRVGPIDRDLLDDLRRLEREEHERNMGRAQRRSPVPADPDAVPIAQRLGAAALDGLLLGGIGAFVLWATLRLTAATPADLGVSALLPLGVFLAAVGVSYLLMFTAAGGQTVGKMLLGIRVVCSGGDEEGLSLSQAAWRAVLAPLSIAVLGLGWIPALFGNGLALHDRLAHTRVVRA